jgi:hypothetical protein
MSITKTAGTQFAIGSTYGTQFTVTGITNANPGVATLSASHGVIVGDFIELTSGWDLANGRIFRASAVATNDVTLEGFNTSDTSKYPAGTGTGTGREITAWTTLSQISPDFGVAGGEQNFADTTFVSNLIRTQIPTDRNPIFPNNSRLVVGAYWSLRGVPTNQDGTLRDAIDLSFIGQPTVYST